jgi:2-polyprenyl-6-methoxyphenol hydroxylase-like FAD-dependent oxidoreductase
VVVGAGPAGLAAAGTLAQAGVDVLVVERRPRGSELPRATVLSVRTMELMRAWGLEEEVRAGADDVQISMLEAPTAARAHEGTPIAVGYPSPGQSAIVSPSSAACVAQDHLESVLLAHVAGMPSVTLVRDAEVVSVGQDGDGATVTVRDASSGTRAVDADYVVGADGSRSAVRAAIGIEMVGPDNVFESHSVEFRARLWEVLGPHRHLLYVLTEPGAQGVLLPAGQGDRWLFAPRLDDGSIPADRSEEALRDHIRRSVGVPELDVRIERLGHFTSGAQLADRFASGRVFLAGDAAHRVTPRGGTGLNIAIADGVDIGWKLSWVLRGWATPSLLSTYEAERRPLVAHNVERSLDVFGSRRGPDTEVHIDLGGRTRHVWVEDGQSTLDLVGGGLTLFVNAGDTRWASAVARIGNRPPVTVVELGPVAARSFGLGSSGATLVRPDGMPIATWWASDRVEDELQTAICALLHRAEADEHGDGVGVEAA